MPYSGIKVLEIPVHIQSASDHDSKKCRTLFNHTFGFTFAGSFLGAYLLKEIIAESLGNLQTIANETISSGRISNFVFKYYRHFFEKLQANFSGHDLDFILAGYCPSESRVMAYKYFIDLESEQPRFHKILDEDGFCWDAIGAGEEKFEVYLNTLCTQSPDKLELLPLNALRAIIHDEAVRSVDGTIQYGSFDEYNNFSLCGVQDWDDTEKQAKLYVRGTDIESVNDPSSIEDFYVTYKYIQPFMEKICEKIKSQWD